MAFAGSLANRTRERNLARIVRGTPMKSEPMALFIEAWTQMTGTLPSPRHERADGVVTCFSDVPNLFFNLWFQDGPTSDEAAFRRMLRAGKAKGAAWHHPTGGVFRADWAPANWEAILVEEGLAIAVPMLGMEATTIVPPAHSAAEIEIRQVTDDATAHDAAMLNAHAYHMPEDEFECVGGMHFWPADSRAFVGYVDGEPVTTAAARSVGGTVYIAMVATEPGLQGQGYAATVMRHAMDEGMKAMGRDTLTLHATMDGQKTYAKMGFVAGPATPLVVPAG
jgi:ribosomal protein S18 acetylase RimI-like enzyme